MARGRFITFEGIDGAGKSTQLKFVANHLQARGIDVVLTREPGGTALGEALRELILHKPMGMRAETLLLFAARAQHIDEVIEPALQQGRWVLCDRFTDASYAYQAGGRGLAEQDIAALERWVHPELQPDLTVVCDVDPAVAAQRLAQARAADRFEAESQQFFARVRAVYLQRAAQFPRRFCVVDSAAAPEAVRTQVLAAMNAALADRLAR